MGGRNPAQVSAGAEHEGAAHEGGELEGAAHEPAVAAVAPAATWKFQLLADREAKWTDSHYWKDFAVGHAWIRLLNPAGGHDSWGYWPDLEGGFGVDTGAPWKSVPGRVRHPDNAHSPTAMQTHEISAEKAEKVTEAANAKEGSPGQYNLFTYNCTTFATAMAHVAGVPVPSYSALAIANPNSLFAGIEASNQQKGLTPMEQPLPPPDEGATKE